MALPRQVQQDIDDLEAYEKSLSAPPKGEETPPTPSEPVVPAVPPEEPTPSVPAAPAAPAAPVDTKKPDEWEHKYRTLEGKYAAEVPRLHAQNKELAQKLQALEQQFEALKQPAQPAQPAVPPVPDALVTDKDVQEYGADLIDVQRRVAREVMRDVVAPLRDDLKLRDAKIAELEQKLKTNTGAVATVSFEQRLAQEIPDFQVLNADPKWISWLDSEDPYTGEPRRVFAEFVYNNGDVAKLKRIVTQFKGVAPVPPNAAEVERQKREAELERQVTPTRANSPSVDPRTTDTTVYTEAQMQQEFNRVRDLNRVGKYDEAAKLEDLLSKAYVEGRVRA